MNIEKYKDINITFLIINIIIILLILVFYKSQNFTVYNPSVDVSEHGKQLIESIELEADRNAGVFSKNGGESLYDSILNKNLISTFNETTGDIILNAKDPLLCYTSFNTSIDKDKCIKQYRDTIINLLNKYGDDNYDINELNGICSYGQNSKYDIENCLFDKGKQFITSTDVCDTYFTNEIIKKSCYENWFNNLLGQEIGLYFIDSLLEYKSDLYKVDSKGRVITKKIDSKMAQDEKYKKQFASIVPLFTDLNSIEDLKKKNKYKYDFLQEKINYYNNIDENLIFKIK